MAREEKEKLFDDIGSYNAWISSQNSFNDAFRMVGLNILNDGTVKVKYIELF
jgi:hypothetical protein